MATRPRVYVSMIGDPATLRYALGQWREALESIEVELITSDPSAVAVTVPPTWSATSPMDAIRRQASGETNSVVLYLMNSRSNYSLIGRLHRFRHLLLLHGESDKLASQTRSLRAYPEIAVSGHAAIERLRRVGVQSRLHVVGRPQVPDATDYSHSAADAILYAPTWEGDNERENYSSLMMPLRESLVHFANSHGSTLIVKLHPKTGSRRSDFKMSAGKWAELAARTPGLELAGEENDVRQYFCRTRLLVTDISSVGTDFMKSMRPIVYLNPFSMNRQDFSQMFPTTHHSPIAGSAEELLDHLKAVSAAGYSVSRERQEVISRTVSLSGAESRKALLKAIGISRPKLR